MRGLAAYGRRLLRLWWLVLLAALVAGGSAALAARLQTPSYRATALVVVRAAPGLPLGRDLSRLINILDSGTLPRTVVTLIQSAETPPQAAALAGLTPEVAADYDLTAQVIDNGRTLAVRATGPDPVQAAALANAGVTVARLTTERLYRLITLEIVAPPTAPATPLRPAPMQDIPLAVGLGTVLGLLLAILLDYLAVAPKIGGLTPGSYL